MTARPKLAAKPEPAPRGRKPFVEAAIAVRFSTAQLRQIDAVRGDEQRARWIRARLVDAIEANRDLRALCAARELLDIVRGSDLGEVDLTVTARFDAPMWQSVVEAAAAVHMIASVWIREVTLAAALPDLYRDAAKLASLAARLSD